MSDNSAKRELRLVTPNVIDVDIRSLDSQIKADLIAAITPVLGKYNMVVVKAHQTTLSDEVSLHLRASVPDGLNQDCFTRDLLAYSSLFGFDPSILGRAILSNNSVSGEKRSFIISGLDVIDKTDASKCKFRVFDKQAPGENRLVDFEVVKNVFPKEFAINK